MENRTYLVTEAEKLTGEKAHVLRYWEDELGMEIHRNSLGHRCYTKRFRRKRQRRQRRSRIRQYREKRTKCRRWLSIFCPSGKQNSWRTL